MLMSGTIIYYHSSSSARRNQSCTDLRIGDQLVEFVRSPDPSKTKNHLDYSSSISKRTLNKTSSVPMRMTDLPGIEGGGDDAAERASNGQQPSNTLQVAVQVESPSEERTTLSHLNSDHSISSRSSRDSSPAGIVMRIPQIQIQSPSPTEMKRSTENHFEYDLWGQGDEKRQLHSEEKSKQIEASNGNHYANANHQCGDIARVSKQQVNCVIDKSSSQDHRHRHQAENGSRSNNNKTNESINSDSDDRPNEQVTGPKDESSWSGRDQGSGGPCETNSYRTACKSVTSGSRSCVAPAAGPQLALQCSTSGAICTSCASPVCMAGTTTQRCNCTVAGRGRNPSSHHEGPSVGVTRVHEHCSHLHRTNHPHQAHSCLRKSNQPGTENGHLNGPDSVRNKAEHCSSRPDSSTTNLTTTATSSSSGGIMSPMISNPVCLSELQMEPDGENPHENPFPNKSRPKPIKFSIGSMARPLSNYFRIPPATPSPTTPTAHYSTSVFRDGGPLTNEKQQHATLHIPRSQQSVHRTERSVIAQSVSVNSLSAMVNSTSSHSITSSSANPSNPSNPTTYVPILISTKDLEAAFLNEPPPLYGITTDQLENSAKGSTLPSVNSLGSLNRQAAVKRTKSFQERIHRVLWGGKVPPSPPKPSARARLSILGKPLPCARVKPQSFMQERVRVYNFLQRPTGIVAVSYHSFVACLIIVGLMFFALSTVPDLECWSMIALRVFDFLILAVLSAEFIALFWASSCIGKYQGFKGAFRFIFSPFRLLDLLVIGISVVVCWTHWLPPSQKYLIWLRCGQVFQILRLENRFKPWRLLSSVLIMQKKHMLITAYMCFLILVVLSYVVYFCEQDDPNTVFVNIPTSIYWGIITVTSIGYGDIAPKTTAGRFIGGVLAILGMIVYAIPSGIIATGLALKVQESNRQKHINNRRMPAARLIQCAWRCYAATLNSTSEATWKQYTKQSRCSTNKSHKLSDMYKSFDHFGSKNTMHSRFNLIDDDEKSNGCLSNRTSHNDLSMHSQEGLTHTEKDCIRFIRAVKFRLARKAFKNAFRPYDIKDVMQQYSEGHADVVGRVRYMQARINTLQAGMSSMAKLVHEMQTTQMDRMDRLERCIQSLVQRVESATNLQNGSFMPPSGCVCCHAPPYQVAGHYRNHGPPPISPIYSESSTVFAQTPTVEHKHDPNDGKSKQRFIWPPMSEEEDEETTSGSKTSNTDNTSSKTSAPLDRDSDRSGSEESVYSHHSCCTTTNRSVKRMRHYSN